MTKSGKYRNYWFNIKRLYSWLCCNCYNIKSKTWFCIIKLFKNRFKTNRWRSFLRVDEDDEWTIIDLGDMFIHLMSEKYRKNTL